MQAVLASHHGALGLGVSPQLEAAGCDPLDELYDALAEVVGTKDTTECYKSYLLVLSEFESRRISTLLSETDSSLGQPSGCSDYCPVE